MSLVINFLTFLLPFSLVFSIFVADLIVVLFSIFLLYLILIKKNYFILKNDFFIFGIFISCYFIFLSFFSKDIFLSLRGSLFFFRFFFFVLLISYLILKKNNTLVIFFYSFLTIYIFIIIDSFIQLYSGNNILGYEYDGTYLKSFFEDEKILGSYLIRTIPIFVGIYFLRKNNLNSKSIFILIFLILILETIIIFTGERTAIALMFILNILIAILAIKYSKKNIIYLSLILIFFLTIISQNSNLRSNIFDRTFQQLTFKDKINIFSYEHEAHYVSALKMFNENKLFGVGPRMFRHECNNPKYEVIITDYEDGCSTHPHHLYIQILSETGLVSFIILITIFLFFSYKVLQIIFKRDKIFDNRTFFLFAIFLNIFPLVPYGNFFNNWISILFFLPFAFIINLESKIFYNFTLKLLNKKISNS